MSSGKRIFLRSVLLVILGILFLSASHTVHSASTITVETELQTTLNSDGQAGYMIFFREKPNLSQAYTMGWKNRGEFVMNSLQSAATSAQAGVQEYLRQHNVSYKTFWIDNIIIVESSSKAVFDGLLNFPEIDSIKARRTMELHEPIKGEGSRAAPMAVGPNIAHVHADDVWGMGYTGTGIVVANIDTGVRYTHETLAGQYRGNLGGGSYNHNYNWWDPSSVCGSPSTAPCDNNGHGTHTMGTIIGDDASHTNQIGMAPGARWIACKGCESNSCSDTALLGCAQFITAPTDLAGANPNPSLRPHVVNNSWGGGGGNNWYQTSVNNWHAAGIYPVFSAGNTGPGCNTAGSPGDYGNITAVGAIDHANNNFPASFSSRGPGAFDDLVNGTPGLLRLKPQVSAPGVNICSSVPDSDISYNCGFSGTSMAAPHVAGLVALIWNAAPCLARNYAATETIIQNTATGLTTTETCGGISGVPNNTTGYGLINALAAVQAAIAQCGPTGTLQGTVIDALTSNPVEDASVSAGGRTELTNASGQYSFTLMPVGTYDVAVNISGYQPITATRVAIADGATTTQNFALSAGRLEVDVAFIDVAMPANTIASRGFTILNSGLITAGFELNESKRSALSINMPPANTGVLRNTEPSSTGKAPKISLAVNENTLSTNTILAGMKAFAIDLELYQLGSFDTDTPGVWSMIGGIGSDYFFAGDFLGDDFTKLYVISYSANQFATIDIDSAAITPIGTSTPYPGESWSGLTSTQDGALYGSATSCSSSTLYSINPTTGEALAIGAITNAPCIIDIAINSQGEMYGLDIVSDNLIKINPTDGTGTIVGPVGFDANYAQGMSFNKATGELYLAAYNNNTGRGELRLADTATGNSILIGAFPNNAEVDSLAFPSIGSIGWFSESPITGTVGVGFYTPVDVTFDSSGMVPGTYGASLNIENTTPYGTISIPLTMYVVSDSTKQYNLSAKKKKVNGGDGIVQSTDSVINCGSTCKVKYYQGPRVSLSASAYPGSTFTGWLPTSLNCTGTGPCVVTMNKAKKVQAVFVGDYSVTVQKKGNGTGRVASQDGGIDCGSTCTAKYPVHTPVTLTATPDPGMQFVKWSPSKLCTGTGPCQVTLDKAKKVTAYFDIQ